jgi:hypothetical protein
MTTLSIRHRPASSISHRRALCSAAATGLVGTLLAITVNSAYAMPGRDGHTAVPAGTSHAHGHYVAHGCFITPHSLSEAVAEALPLCYTRVP